MFGHTFKGGIHPYDGKELSKDKAISSILPKGDLVYPLSQHIGAPAVPIVEKGEHGGPEDCGGRGFCLCAHSCVSIRKRERR